jgi:hypothetical protein
VKKARDPHHAGKNSLTPECARAGLPPPPPLL